MTRKIDFGKSEKILQAIYKLDKLDKIKKHGNKIPQEMIAVKVWKMFPLDFSLSGYPQYPNNHLSSLITPLKIKNLIKGGVNNYRITEKGIKFIEDNMAKNKKKEQEEKYSKKMAPRYINFEINRILNSKVFEYFSKGNRDFLETDLFEFLGTSARSFKDSNQSNFLSKYNLVIKEVIPFCNKNGKLNDLLKEIVKLWGLLQIKFSQLLKNG